MSLINNFNNNIFGTNRSNNDQTNGNLNNNTNRNNIILFNDDNSNQNQEEYLTPADNEGYINDRNIVNENNTTEESEYFRQMDHQANMIQNNLAQNNLIQNNNQQDFYNYNGVTRSNQTLLGVIRSSNRTILNGINHLRE